MTIDDVPAEFAFDREMADLMSLAEVVDLIPEVAACRSLRPLPRTT